MGSQEELSLRDLVMVLKKNLRLLALITLVFLALSAIYAFWAENVYTAQATLSLATDQIQAQLEQRIRLQQNNRLPFEAVRAVAFSEEVLTGVWQALKKDNLLPSKWENASGRRGFEQMMRDFQIKEQSAKRNDGSDGKALIVQLGVHAPSPRLASRTANLWAEHVVEAINRVPYRNFEKSLAYLKNSLEEAQKQYLATQARWLEFSQRSTLPSDKLELEQLIQERIRLDQAIATVVADLDAVRSRLHSYQAAIQDQRTQLSGNISPDQAALINRSFEDARKSLSEELERFRQAFEQAAQEQEVFAKHERISEAQIQVNRLAERLGEISIRLGTIATEKAQKQASLQELEALLGREPRLVEVLREVVMDPIVATAVEKGDWRALESLRIKAQELNPAYLPLFNQTVELRATLIGLTSAEQALRNEQLEVSKKLESYKQLLASQLRTRDRLNLVYSTRKAAYESLLSRFEQLGRMSPQQLTFASPNPEYLRLRGTIIDVEAEKAGLEGRLTQLQNRLDELNKRIEALRGRVAKAQLEQDNALQAMELSKNTYMALTQKKTDLEIEASSSQSPAQVLVQAYPSHQKASPNRALIILVGTILGILVALVGVFLFEAVQVNPSSTASAA
ncbi:Wzz/FepE/Etk N-terminal domain-containing protein [Meiothermus sp.]|uniref:Wzz/FepE/Etk N-terminal domain-containing protein n=1 Tax=Meiothermus sp. TaxID=1955249 RepID=UPI0021DD6655|nr:Wzz/FepE/Etk N-terminal domain-containing protein [Meiothermus sp.]GIW24384.1 MAG: chain-length determining protein [Meiothermus sp.]